jgi:hypothetical protein
MRIGCCLSARIAGDKPYCQGYSHSFGQIKLGREIFLPEKFEAETRPPMLQLAEL